MRRTTLLAGFSAATLLTGLTFAHANPTGAKGDGTHNCSNTLGADGYTVTWTPTQVFPPNHKMVTGTLTYTAPASHPTSNLALSIDAIGSDEVVDGEELQGSGNTTDDTVGAGTMTSGTGSISLPFSIRAERSGTGDGRTYTIGYTATDTAVVEHCSQDVATSDVQINVPHDMGGGNGA